MPDSNKRKKNILSSSVHAGEEWDPASGVSSAIYQSATFRFGSPEEIGEAMVSQAHPQFYGRYATPNTKQVEAAVAELEGGETALAVASGMAAISLVFLGCLESGDHIVTQRALYATTYNLMKRKLPKLGIQVTFVDQTAPDEFAAAILPETRLIYVESPANPVLSLTDLSAVADIAKKNRLLAVADNTFASSFNQRPLGLGYDLVVHSATKYLAGHSDVIAGIIVGNNELVGKLWRNHTLFGAVLHPFEAWLLARGIKTYGLRMAQHNANAMEVARFLEIHPAVKAVYYPGLPSHPQHELAKQQMTGGFGGMVCFDLEDGLSAGYTLLKSLKMISLAVSLGGVHSLITHPASTISVVQKEDELAASGVIPGLVRFSVGVEEVGDIIADLEQALSSI